MTWYVVGPETQLGVTQSEPRVIVNVTTKEKLVLWLASSLVGRHDFPLKRGIVEEYRLLHGGERVYARVLPEDAVPELEAFLAEDERLLAALKANRRARQEFLAAVVPRSARVRAFPEQSLAGKVP